MHIGINQVILSRLADGVRQREMAVMPHLLQRIAEVGGSSTVYFAREMDRGPMEELVAGVPGAQPVQTPVPRLPTSLRLLRGVGFWRDRARRDGLSLFHTSYYPSPRLKVPVVVTVHDLRIISHPETYPFARRQFLRTAIPYTLQRAARIIAVSHFTKQDIVEYYGIEPDTIDVAYNPPRPLFRVIEDEDLLEKSRRALKLPHRFLLFVGCLEPRKNLRRLLQAYSCLRDRGEIDHALVILGKPNFGFAQLLRDAAASSYAADVVFTGFVPDAFMPCVYNLADALTFPSLHEGFGIPIIEAMSCGLPVLTSNVTAMAEVAGPAAVLVNPHDVDSIAEGIARVTNDSELRDALVCRGRERVKLFRPQRTARAIFGCYEKTLQAA